MSDQCPRAQSLARLTGWSAHVIRIAYSEAVEKVGALPIENLTELGSILDDLRKPAKKAQR